MKSIVIYFSHSGNTRAIAQAIMDVRGINGIEIIPKKAYPHEYVALEDYAHQEILRGDRPRIEPIDISLHDYDLIYLGTPTWWSAPAPVVLTFLEKFSDQATLIAPFCTHGGGGAGHIASDLQAKILPIFASYGDHWTKVALTNWLKRIENEVNVK